MKKIITSLAMALALSNFTAMAVDSQGANNDFYVKPDVIAVDPTTNMGTLTVWFNNETDNFNSFMMDFYLPEGFTVEKNNRGAFKITFNNDDYNGKVYDHTMSVTPREEGFYRFIGFSMSQTWVATGDDWFFRFNIVAPEGYSSQTTLSEGYVRKIEISSGNTPETSKTHYMPDITFKVGPESIVSGVEEVGIDNNGEIDYSAPYEVYNLSGAQVATSTENLNPGIYIIRQVDKVHKVAIR